MTKINRRKFIYSSAMLAAIPAISSDVCKREGNNKFRRKAIICLLGVISSADNPEKDLKIVKDLGFPTCQLSIDTYSPELAKRVSDSLIKYNLIPSSLICMGPGTYKWNFTEGPSTIGLVPRAEQTGTRRTVKRRELNSARLQVSLLFMLILALSLKIRRISCIRNSSRQ